MNEKKEVMHKDCIFRFKNNNCKILRKRLGRNHKCVKICNHYIPEDIAIEFGYSKDRRKGKVNYSITAKTIFNEIANKQMENEKNKERKCSFNECRQKLHLIISFHNFEKTINSNRILNLPDRLKLFQTFLKIWNNPKIAIFCCTHYRQVNKFIKDSKKHTRLIKRSQKIIKKYKLDLNQLIN